MHDVGPLYTKYSSAQALISSSALSVKSLNLPTPFSSMVPQGLLFVFLFPNNRVKLDTL
jgi:hypothetical protein